MKTDQFWEIIDTVNSDSGGDMDRKCELLRDRLTGLEPQVLRDFIEHFDAADLAAYSWSLWGAAYVMHGGCSDDSFSDFRATLISLGRTTYERALSDPESLIEVNFKDEEDICYEGFQFVKNDVAEQMLGGIPERTNNFPEQPSGEEWDEETVEQLYPKLAENYSRSVSEEGAPRSSKPWWKLW